MLTFYKHNSQTSIPNSYIALLIYNHSSQYFEVGQFPGRSSLKEQTREKIQIVDVTPRHGSKHERHSAQAIHAITIRVVQSMIILRKPTESALITTGALSRARRLLTRNASPRRVHCYTGCSSSYRTANC